MQTGEKSVRFSFGEEISEDILHQIRLFSALLHIDGKLEVEDAVPSYTTVHVYLTTSTNSPLEWAQTVLEKWGKLDIKTADSSQSFKHIRIPVCYEDAFSLDMQKVMDHTSLAYNDIIKLHTSASYSVYAIGFLPGFPYLGGLDPRLATPRLEVPRKKAAEGTVGIGGAQTGVYPVSSPAGWNIIGRTPLALYEPKRETPFLCSPGDIVTFQTISKEQFWELKEQLKRNPNEIQHWIT